MIEPRPACSLRSTSFRQKHGVNPVDYFTDVLTRVHTHPARDVADLLPHRWKPPERAAR